MAFITEIIVHSIPGTPTKGTSKASLSSAAATTEGETLATDVFPVNSPIPLDLTKAQGVSSSLRAGAPKSQFRSALRVLCNPSIPRFAPVLTDPLSSWNWIKSVKPSGNELFTPGMIAYGKIAITRLITIAGRRLLGDPRYNPKRRKCMSSSVSLFPGMEEKVDKAGRKKAPSSGSAGRLRAPKQRPLLPWESLSEADRTSDPTYGKNGRPMFVMATDRPSRGNLLVVALTKFDDRGLQGCDKLTRGWSYPINGDAHQWYDCQAGRKVAIKNETLDVPDWHHIVEAANGSSEHIPQFALVGAAFVIETSSVTGVDTRECPKEAFDYCYERMLGHMMPDMRAALRL